MAKARQLLPSYRTVGSSSPQTVPPGGLQVNKSRRGGFQCVTSFMPAYAQVDLLVLFLNLFFNSI